MNKASCVKLGSSVPAGRRSGLKSEEENIIEGTELGTGTLFDTIFNLIALRMTIFVKTTIDLFLSFSP
jgi:hypothetical protein